MRTMIDDAELLRRYTKENSEEAFAELVRRHLPLVYNAALRQLANATHRAEDVAQMVFTDLVRKAPSLARRSHLGGWLYLSTHYAAAKLKRAEQRRQIREQAAHVMNGTFSDASVEVEWEQLRPVLDDAMVELSERDRQVILLRFFENCRLRDVGEKLGLSEDAARMRLDRALERLRAALGKRGISSTTAAIGLLLTNQTVVAAPAALAATVTSTALTAATAGSAVALLQFMSTAKVTVGIASVVVALVLATSTRELMASRVAESRLVERRHDYETMLAARADLEKQAQTLEAEVAELRKQIAEPRAAEAPVAASETKPAEAWDPIAGGEAFLQRHPAVRDALLAQKNAVVDSRYGPLYAALGWNEEQIDEFRRLTRSAFLSLPGTDPGPILVSTEPPLTSEARAPRMDALLGPEGTRRMEEFRAREPARTLAMRVATGLGFTAEPLTPEQAAALVDSIPLVTPAGRKTKEVDWNEVIAATQGILTPAQLPALERLKALQMAEQRQQSTSGK